MTRARRLPPLGAIKPPPPPPPPPLKGAATAKTCVLGTVYAVDACLEDRIERLEHTVKDLKETVIELIKLAPPWPDAVADKIVTPVLED
jgi:hypothetical protein